MAGFAEYEDYDALGLAALIRAGEVRAREVLEAAIERADARDPAINAIVRRFDDKAFAAIAAGLPNGPFAGVPYLLKDLTSPLAGEQMTRGSRFFADVVPDRDNRYVTLLKRAGFVLFGKTNTCELGMSLTCEPQLHGATRNPFDPTRMSGGSSGGSAAAVGARIVPMAHATDGFGSIRVPAACCGLVGLKPTRARNSAAPFTGEGLAGLSSEHAVSLSVRDSAALLDWTAGPGPGDPYVAPPPGDYLAATEADPAPLRIGVWTEAPNGAPIDAEPMRLLRDTADLLSDLGHRVAPAVPAIEAEAIVPTFRTIMAANMALNLRHHPISGRPARQDEVERTVWAQAQAGEALAAPDYVAATQAQHRLGRQMAAVFADCDVLLMPALANLPLPLGTLDMMLDDLDEYWRRVFSFSPFTVLFNITGQPAMMLPLEQFNELLEIGGSEPTRTEFALGASAGGLPVAVQIAAAYGGEATLFALAAQLERARPWRGRRPASLA